MSIHRYVEILQLDVPTVASGRVWPKSVVAACILNLPMPVYGMIGMPSTYSELENLPDAKKTHVFHDLYISGGYLYGEVEIFDQALIDFVEATEGTYAEAVFRVAALTKMSVNAFGDPQIAHMELKSINAMPGERILTGEVI